MQEKYVRLRSYPGGHLTYRSCGIPFRHGEWTRVPEIAMFRGEPFPLGEFLASRQYDDGRNKFDVTDKAGAMAIEERERSAAEQLKRETALAAVTGSVVERASLQGTPAADPVSLPAATVRDDGAQTFTADDLANEKADVAEIQAAEERIAAKAAAAKGEKAPEAKADEPAQPTASRRAARNARRADKPPA